jgi:TonB-linked SusC/RagA family outer membrane protein
MQINLGVKMPQHAHFKPHKIFLVMKLTVFLITIACIQVSAAAFSQKISLKEKNVSLNQVLTQIQQQSGYEFFYNVSAVKQAGTVSVDLHDVSVQTALAEVFKDKPFEFHIEDQTIIIKEKELSLIDKEKAFFALFTVSGKVEDETGQPLPGVTVKIKGTGDATATDKNGAYTLTVPDDKTVVSFSFIGYETIELAAKDIQAGSVIRLKATQTNLQEVVVGTGYFKVKQELSTSNITKITSEVFENQPVSDPMQALEGRVPGLQVSQVSGLPGANINILLRGKNSLANGNVPLYIINGVPFLGTTISEKGTATALNSANNAGMSPFSTLSVGDIESIEILKDADATAIYGSRGANGVILITTKQGKAGSTRVDANVNNGWGTVPHTLQLLNTQQYLQMRHEALKNDGSTPGSTDYDFNGSWDTTRYTDWQKKLIGGTARFTNAQLSLSGGTANTQFLVGGTYNYLSTVFPGSLNDQKVTGNVNINHHSDNQKFHAQFSSFYTNDNNTLPTVDLTSMITLPPDAPALYKSDGSLNFQSGTFSNPLAYTLKTANAITNTLNSNLNLSYEFLPGLQIKTGLGYTRMQMEQTTIIPGISNYNPSVNSRSNQFSLNDFSGYIIEPQLTYGKKLGKGKLDILVGSTFQSNTQHTQFLTASGFSSDALIPNRQLASSLSINDDNSSNYRYNSLYGRIGYNWDNKYLLNLTARRDGSSRFGPGNQFGNFGSVGAGWIFSKEHWMDNVSWLSFGKLRGSYGTVGNDQIPDYQYLSSYSATGANYQNTAGLVPSRIASPYYAWELTKKLEAGLDLSFFKDRIQLTADWYRSQSGNQLVGQRLASIAGFTSLQANLPALVQNTGWEFQLNTTNVRSGQFRWNSAFNISIPKNKLVSFPGLANSPYSQSYVVGQSLYLKYLLHYTGLDPNTGLYTFEDTNHDGTIDGSELQLIKSVAQQYFGGFQNSFSYKGWSLDVFFQFVKQTGFDYYSTANVFPGSFNTGNVPTYFLNRWQKPGDITTTGRFTTGNGAGAFSWYYLESSDYTIVDASFIRLKNVSLSYDLPVSWQKKLSLSRAQIYLQAQNLFTITGYKGLDPETQGLSLPPLRMITLGLKLSL